MFYPFDPLTLNPPGAVTLPEPLYIQEKSAIRNAQRELIEELPYVYLGANTTQYTIEDYQEEPGIGRIHFNNITNMKICEDIAFKINEVLDGYPFELPLSENHDDYWFIGELTELENPVNKPTMDFMDRFFELLKKYEFNYVNSVAYEILDFFMLPEWKQLNHKGDPAQSGWYPPSSFIQPTNTDALDYISNVQIQILQSAKDKGLDLYFQIGEPWWWDGSYNTGEGRNAPCIYDPLTMELYETETGNSVPTPWITDIFAPVANNQWYYIDWLCVKLGESTNYIRDKVKEEFEDSKATLLFFSPQVMSPASELTFRLNFPISEWVYPNYDFIQIEDYDWLIDGRIQLVPLTFQAATEYLKYPLETVHYFLGFVLLPENAERIWGNVDQALGLAIQANIPHIYPWSYTQVVRDGVIFEDNTCCSCNL